MPYPADAQTMFASLAPFDWVLVVLVVVSAALAFRRGMIKVVFSFVGVAAGTVLAGWYSLQGALWLHAWIGSMVAARMVAFVGILMLVTLLCSAAAQLVRRTVQAAGLGMFDRLLGGLFGAARGGLLGVALVLAIAAFVPRSAWLKNSQLVPYFLTGAHAVSFLMPRQVKQQVDSGTASLLRQPLLSSRPRRDSF